MKIFGKLVRDELNYMLTNLKFAKKWFFIDHISIYTEIPETIIQEEIQGEKERTEEKGQNGLPSSVQIQQPEETKTLEEYNLVEVLFLFHRLPIQRLSLQIQGL